MGSDDTTRLWVCDACNEEWASVERTECRTCGTEGAPVPSTICTACGEVIRESARVCRHCGTGLETKPCPSCAAIVGAGSPTCSVCGWSFDKKPKKGGAPTKKGRRFGLSRREPGVRPFRVILLGILYALIGLNLCLPVLFGALADLSEYGVMGTYGGVLVLVPGALFFVAAAGFFLRSRWAPGLALVLGLAALAIALFGGVLGLFEKDGRTLGALSEWTLRLVLWLLHMVLVLSDTTTRWFTLREA